MAYLSYKELRAKGACADQLALFRKHFGQGGEVTLDLCLEHASTFDWGWAAWHLLSDEAQAEYARAMAPAWAEYERVRASALAEYERVTAPALAEYERVRASALAEYKRALEEYGRITASAWEEYKRVRASAWFAAWEKDHSK